MAVSPTYPGVYIEEIPSGVRTITGVATSITAFIGRTLRGPVNEPTIVRNFGEFERMFGGRAADHTVAYAVSDFFGNGGAKAVVVRLYAPFFADDAARAAALLTATGLAQTGANAVATAAGVAADANLATAASVAAAAVAAIAGAGAQQAAGQLVAAAAQTEAAIVSSPADTQRCTISGDPTGGTVTLGFDGGSSGPIPLTDLTAPNGDALLQAALETNIPALVGNLASIVRSGSDPNFVFDIAFGGALTGVQERFTLDDNSLTGGTSPTLVIVYPDAERVAAAAAAAVASSVASAAGAAAPINRARITLDNGLVLEAASPGAWGNALSVTVDFNTKDTSDTSLFNMTIKDALSGRSELIRNVTGTANAVRIVDRVLAEESALLRVSGAVPAARPSEGLSTVDAGGISSDSLALTASDYKGSLSTKTGIFALEKADLFNMLCLPPDTRSGNMFNDVYQDAMGYCEKKRAMLIVDPPAAWGDNPDPSATAIAGLPALALSGSGAKNAALFFPRFRQSDPMREGQIDTFAPCGAVAGIFARTDATRGVWKAPAGLEASVNGIVGLQANLSNDQNGDLNPLGINCLRIMPAAGPVVWGSRTLQGDDRLASEWKYVPVRRTALFIEETLFRNTQWVVFEPNDEPLWSQIRLNIGAFMHNLFRQGAFQGSTPKDAYFVKCDSETTTQNDINLGIVNILVGFAPLKPAEFVMIKIQQMAGQIQS